MAAKCKYFSDVKKMHKWKIKKVSWNESPICEKFWSNSAKFTNNIKTLKMIEL